MRKEAYLSIFLIGSMTMGCAPVATVPLGGAPHLPIIQKDSRKPTKVAQGSTVYVQYDFLRNETGIPKKFYKEVKFPRDWDKDVKDAEKEAEWLRVKTKPANKGIEVKKLSAKLVKVVENINEDHIGITDLSYYETVRVLFEVKVDKGTRKGKHIVFLTFADGDQEKYDFKSVLMILTVTD